MLPSRPGSAQGGVTPLPPDEKAFGLTLAEWSAAYTQWWLSIPKSVNPTTDATFSGRREGIGQRMPVWFISGSGDQVVIPAGYAILVLAGPNWVTANTPGDWTEDQLRAELRKNFQASLDQLKVIEFWVDGVPVPDLERYRVESPLFTLVLPPGNLFDRPVTAGKDPRVAAVAAGYFVMLPALPVGKHELHWLQKGIASQSSAPFENQHTSTLTIQNANEPLP